MDKKVNVLNGLMFTDELYGDLRELADKEGKTVAEVISDALQKHIEKKGIDEGGIKREPELLLEG
jgi:hypothetical protein